MTDAPQDAPPAIRFGIAGWSYPDWEGVVYGRDTKDPLEYVSRFVDVVEVNSTFYRPPSPSAAASWVRRTRGRPGFFFTAKVHRDITHGGRLDPVLIEDLRRGLGPLREAGMLRHLLAQFRYDFDATEAHRNLLLGMSERLSPLAEIVVEVRHASWQSAAGLEFLERLGVSVAHLDYPAARSGFDLRDRRIGAHGYFRLHGRNRAAWFDRDAGRDETYDYLYSREELLEIKERVLAVARGSSSLTVIGNNHFRGKELANILELKSLVTGERLPVPRGLVAEYPRLAEIAIEEGPRTGELPGIGG